MCSNYIVALYKVNLTGILKLVHGPEFSHKTKDQYFFY